MENQKNDLAKTLDSAIAHHQAGRLQQAADLYRRILQISPEHPDALHLLGTIAQQTGHTQAAIDLITRAIRCQPDNPLYHFNLSTTCLLNGQLEHAIAAGEQALALKPDYLEAHLNLASACRELHRYQAAMDHLQQVVTLQPNYAEAWLNMGNILLEQNQVEQALRYYEQSHTLKPDQPQTVFNIGNAHMVLGDFDQAMACFRQALQLRPDFGDAFGTISTIKRFRNGDEDITRMEALLQQSDLASKDRISIHFALGKAYEDCGHYEQAFISFRDGNRLKYAGFQYSTAMDARFFQRLKTVYNRDFFKAHCHHGLADSTPIFILGMPRSGTTLVEKILASYPLVYGAGEVNDLQDILSGPESVLDRPATPEHIATLDAADTRRLAQAYLDSLGRFGSGWRHIINKLPGNFQFVGLIQLLFPRATIIHCRRDPMANCWSCFKNYFHSSQEFTYDLEALGRYYRLYEDLMQHWHQVLPERIYDIRYESLVNDQEGESRKLLDWCGLPWDEACLDFHRSRAQVRTASIAQVRRPIYRQSVRLWEHYRRQPSPLAEILSGKRD